MLIQYELLRLVKMKHICITLCLAGVLVTLLVVFNSPNGTDNHHGRFLSEQLMDDGTVDMTTLGLFPLRPVDYIGFAAVIGSLIISAGGGVGGGGLLVPIFTLLFRFPVKHAVGLSNVSVFGGAVANTILNVYKRHPWADRPLIDWDLLAMMEPLTMAGALLGADLNVMLPDVLVVIMLVVLLSFMTTRILQKANKMHSIETAERTSGCDETVPLASRAAGSNSIRYGSDTPDINKEGSTGELLQLLQQESKTPWTRILQVASLFVVVIFFNFIKGGKDTISWLPFQVTCGSVAFFTLHFVNIFIIVLFAICIRRTLIQTTSKKLALSYVFIPGDVAWDKTNTIKYSCICSLAGVFAGLFGIGGGIVKSPLMLEMGVHPAVASATSSTMILLTSFTATTSYIVHGQLNHEYAAMCVVVGFSATILGQSLMHALLVKQRRNSYIAYSVALVVGISGVAMTLEAAMSLQHDHHPRGPAGLCSSGE